MRSQCLTRAPWSLVAGVLSLACGPTVDLGDGQASTDVTGWSGHDSAGSTSAADTGADMPDSGDSGSSSGGDTAGESTGPARPPSCGNGVVESGEPCDDGNEVDRDGCTAECTITPGARAVAVGAHHTCALTWAGTVHCWGLNDHGELGYGHVETIGDDEPASFGGAVDVGGPVQAIAAGTEHTCSLLDDGGVRCWGRGWGQLGYLETDDIGDDEVPADVGDIDLGGTAVRIFAGGYHSCALLDTGGLRCWGSALDHPIGYPGGPQVGYELSPAEAGDLPLPEPVVDVALGFVQTCVVGVSGAVWCWGENYNNVLSVPQTEVVIAPDVTHAVRVDVGTDAVAVAAGFDTTTVRTHGGNVRAWGYWGSLGYGQGAVQVGDVMSPAEAGDLALGEPVVELSTGIGGSCARSRSGVRCWGDAVGLPGVDEIGVSDVPADHPPVDVGAEVVSLAPTDALAHHDCVVTASGGVRCWGAGAHGQLGHGNSDSVGDVLPPSAYGDVPFL